MSNMIQWYKGQVGWDGILLPVVANGANMDWNANYSVPALAGNLWEQNYIEGVQVPACDLQVLSVDGEGSKNPLIAAFLSKIMTRSSDASHDVTGYSFTFFDGYSGWSGLKAKCNSFNIRGAKGEDVAISMQLMCYKPYSDPAPSSITTAPFSHNGWAGAPVRFQSLTFLKNGVAFDGVVSFNLTYSNGLTPDMSMSGQAQQVYPIDCNASSPTCSLQLVFHANSVGHIAEGDSFTIKADQGSSDATFLCQKLLPGTLKSRNIGGGRQMRVYTCRVVGTDNSNPPLVVS